VVLNAQLPWLEEVIPAEASRRKPVVLTPDEIWTFLNELYRTAGLVASSL
jgi:hypothetical protein